MNFANPAFLYAFVLLTIPVIIHLFNFRKYKTLYFSSLRFLESVEKSTKNTQKLKHILVLITRLLAFSFLILAFAQPYIPIDNNKNTGKGFTQSIFIDNSFSMEAKGMQGELVSEAKEAAKEIITSANPNTNFLIFTNELSGTERRILNKQDALDKIDRINKSPSRKDIHDVIQLHSELIEKGKHNSYNQLILLSDFQKNQSLINNLSIDSSTIYQLVKLHPQNKENLFIDSIWFSTPLRKLNNNNELNLRIINTGEQAITNTELILKIGDYTRNMLVDVDSKSSVIKTFNYSDKSKGIKSGSVEINDQQLFFDDKFHFSYEVKPAINVLILNQETSVENPEYVYETDDFYQLKSLDYRKAKRDEILESDLLILNGLNNITTGQISLFETFVSNGGSLFIIPGEKMNADNYNLLLDKLQMPNFGKLNSNNLSLTKLNVEDEFYEGIFQESPKNINLPNVLNKYNLNTGNNYSYISLLDFQNNSPFFVRSIGNNKVYLIASALQEDHSSFIKHSLFSTILLKIGELSQRNNPLYSTLGNSNSYKFRVQNDNQKAVHLVQGKTDVIPYAIRKPNFIELSLDNKSLLGSIEDGIYSIQQDSIIGELALNYNRKESVLEYSNLKDLVSQLKSQGAKSVYSNTIVNAQEIAELDFEKPHTYWRILLFLSLVFLIIEMLLLRTKLFKN